MPSAARRVEYPAAILERYRKLKARADDAASSASERAVASKKMGELELEYPGLGVEATRPPVDPIPEHRQVDPSSLFSKAMEIASQFLNGVETDQRRDKLLQRLIQVHGDINRNGRLLLTVDIRPHHLDQLLSLVEREGPTTGKAVARWLGTQVEQEFLEILGDLAEEDDFP